jgi:hypothetical protein
MALRECFAEPSAFSILPADYVCFDESMIQMFLLVLNPYVPRNFDAPPLVGAFPVPSSDDRSLYTKSDTSNARPALLSVSMI